MTVAQLILMLLQADPNKKVFVENTQLNKMAEISNLLEVQNAFCIFIEED